MKALIKHFTEGTGKVTETVVDFPLTIRFANYNDASRKIVGTNIFDTDIISISVHEE